MAKGESKKRKSPDSSVISTVGPCGVMTWAFRLLPGQDLFTEIENITEKCNIEAGFIISCVGSLSKASIRFGGKKKSTKIKGELEVISLSGTISTEGSHMHICVSDGEGKSIGGHVTKGCIVRTTMEVIVGSMLGATFERETCVISGYDELAVKKKMKF
eukprot:TRINITY_DN479_c0_g4_i1.p1 TRINITY_DN479_c0_g4~~TRINITY_DN479_c0_g4_i1.p1  ORF type:complete len:159 (+),score=29.58 TRINITY_DN479_c0_g4_i1:77-553(+)